MSHTLIYEAARKIDAMDDAELRKLQSAADRLTETNCSWAAHLAAPIVRDLVRETIAIRKRAKKRATVVTP